MQYKLKVTRKMWVPKNGLKVWKGDVDHKPLLPKGSPTVVKPKEMTKEVEIIHGLDGFI